MSETNNNTIFEFTAVYQTNDTTKEHYKNGTTQQNNEQKSQTNPYNIFKHIEAATEQINNATFNYTREVNEIASKLFHKTFEHITLQHDEITKLQSRLQLQMAKTKQLQENVNQDYCRYDHILENITEQLYNRKLMKRVLKNWHSDIRNGPINMGRAYNNKISDDSMGEHDEVESIKTLENEILKLKSEKSVLLNSVKNAVSQGLSFITNETMKALDPNETVIKSPVSQHSSKTEEFSLNNVQTNSVRYPQDNCQMCSCNFDYMYQKNSNNTLPMQHCNCKSKFTSICCDNVRQMHDFELKHGDKNDSCLYQQPIYDNRLLSEGPQFTYDLNGYTFCNRFGGGGGNGKNIIPCFGKRPYIRMPHNKRKKKNMQQRGNAKVHKQMESSDFNQQTDMLKNSILNNKRVDEFDNKKTLFKTDTGASNKANENKTDDTKPTTDTTISAREKLEKALFRSVENYECNSECCCNLQNESKNEEPTKTENNNSETKSIDDLTKSIDFHDDNNSEHNSECKTQVSYIELSNNTSSPIHQQAQSPRQTVGTPKQQGSPKFNQFETKIDVASLKKQFQQEQFPKTKTNQNNTKRMSMSDCALLEKCTYFRNISENSSPIYQEDQMDYINDYNRTVRKNFLADDFNNSDGNNKTSSKRIFNRSDKNQKKKCACLSVCTCPIWCTLDNIEEKVIKKTSTNTSLENSPRSDNPYNSDCKCLFRGIH